MRIIKRDVKSIYKQWAKNYDSNSRFNIMTEMEKDLIIPILAPRKNEVILDIGCGTGRFSIPLAKKCRRIVGIDFSGEMIETAKRNAKNTKNIEFRKVDASGKFPFPDNSFDKALCTLVVPHIGNLPKFLYEIRRVLKKGGIFVFDDFVPDLTKYRLKYRDPIREQLKKSNTISKWRPISEHVNTLHRVGFDIEKTVFTRVDKRVKHVFSPMNYKKNKGRSIAFIFRCRKD